MSLCQDTVPSTRTPPKRYSTLDTRHSSSGTCAAVFLSPQTFVGAKTIHVPLYSYLYLYMLRPRPQVPGGGLWFVVCGLTPTPDTSNIQLKKRSAFLFAIAWYERLAKVGAKKRGEEARGEGGGKINTTTYRGPLSHPGHSRYPSPQTQMPPPYHYHSLILPPNRPRPLPPAETPAGCQPPSRCCRI